VAFVDQIVQNFCYSILD